ncbi:hypothetical protein DRO69_09545, partial [Candidatus Bathyarchaeota archaeon]
MRKKILPMLTILILISGIFAFMKPAIADYPATDETAIFSDPDVMDFTGQVPPKTYTFDIKIQKKTGVTTIAFSLHFGYP